ncbi:MAG: hypothetical protein AAF982_03885 [Pseudomonadota bacterium]
MNEQQNPDAGLGVEFFIKPVRNAAKSRAANRPIFEDREFIRLRFPGDNKRELVAPADEMHWNGNTREQMTYADRFRANYEAFKQGQKDFITGTPLTAMPEIAGAKREELKALDIVTVEQLAALATPARRRLGMGGMELVTAAKDYLEKAAGLSELEALRARVAELEAGRADRVPAADAPGPDPFEGMTDEDLKNMLRDAGSEIPRGNARRETLIARLNEIAAAKAAEEAA